MFPYSNWYKPFMNSFKKVIKENQLEFNFLCIDVSDLVSHSAQKGVCSFAAAVISIAPPIVSICL